MHIGHHHHVHYDTNFMWLGLDFEYVTRLSSSFSPKLILIGKTYTPEQAVTNERVWFGIACRMFPHCFMYIYIGSHFGGMV